jgi:hypothetical protein
VNALGAEYALLKSAVQPFSIITTTTMAQRVYLNLKLLYIHPHRSCCTRTSIASFGFSRMTASTPYHRDPFLPEFPPAISVDHSPRMPAFLGEFRDRPFTPGFLFSNDLFTGASSMPEASEDVRSAPACYLPPAFGVPF